MAGVYKWKKLSDININDNFFDSLKSDYPFFEAWFKRKAKEEKVALTYYESDGLNAFMMLKNNEDEAITLKDKTLMKKNRLKISTLKLSPKVQGNRLGEGAIGIALWNWLESDCEEIYITIFEKQLKLISMLKKMGFIFVGYNLNNECVYLRSKKYIDFSNPYLSFPFICKKENSFSLLPIEAVWHDKLFPYSELKNVKTKPEELAASNGITKTYLFYPCEIPAYKVNQPILIYRKHTEQSHRTYKSVITSYGRIVKCIMIKYNRRVYYSLNDYKKIVGNKSVFPNNVIEELYYSKTNLFVLELVYDHAFGSGNNVNHYILKSNGIWKNVHPYQAEYTMNDFRAILKYANQNAEKLIK